ncbi:YidH family protein [Demequina sediminicola]|uniref:YidH family protein n=1 Tax=Demequina sediminicola TaxID=1095026 RepID=UPI0007842915|nr:DUF202 domain-containing protein [Demequina sediminicola]
MGSQDNSGDLPVSPQVGLANERTFLAWIRTSLGLTATGAALVALDPPVHPGWLLASGGLFVVLGIACAIQAWLGWRATDRDARRGDWEPTLRMGVVITAGVVVATVTLMAGALLL